MWFAIELIGQIVVAVVAAGVLSVVLALAVAGRVARGRWAPLKRLSIFVLDFFFLPLKLLLHVLPGKRSLDPMMVALKNAAYRTRFARSKRRLLMAPTCLRHLDCPAPSTRRGIQCKCCGRCKVGEIVAEARRLGYKPYVLTGSSFVPQILADEKPDAALLVACPYECNKVMMALGGLTSYAVPLDRDGCVNTDVSLDRVIEAMKLGLDEADQPEAAHA